MILFATSNPAKYRVLSQFIEAAGIALAPASMELPEPRSTNVREVAQAKAEYAYRELGQPCLAVDSAFFIAALGGFPSTFVNYVLGTIGVEGLLRLVEGRDRACEFQNCLAYMDADLEVPATFISPVPGCLSLVSRGELPPWAWSELYQVFVPAGTSMTLAEMGRQEYQQWSENLHRDSCLSRFARWFRESGRHTAREG